MKKYRLKDHELQKKLEALDPEFGDKLQKGIKSSMNHILVGIMIDLNCLETYQPYDPNNWNSYPKVTPPYDVLMRVELSNGNGYKAFLHKFIEGDLWCFGDGKVMPKAMSDSVRHFRPWG